MRTRWGRALVGVGACGSGAILFALAVGLTMTLLGMAGLTPVGRLLTAVREAGASPAQLLGEPDFVELMGQASRFMWLVVLPVCSALAGAGVGLLLPARRSWAWAVASVTPLVLFLNLAYWHPTNVASALACLVLAGGGAWVAGSGRGGQSQD